MGQGAARELALTGRTFSGQEAVALGLATHAYPTREALAQGAAELAAGIAAKSPITVTGIKRVLLHQRWAGDLTGGHPQPLPAGVAAAPALELLCSLCHPDTPSSLSCHACCHPLPNKRPHRG